MKRSHLALLAVSGLAAWLWWGSMRSVETEVRAAQLGPRVAFLVMGLPEDRLPIWASPGEALSRYKPPKSCGGCQPQFHMHPLSKGEGKDYSQANEGWWCAQRHFLEAVQALLASHPTAQWYFFADEDTLVFPQVLHKMLSVLDDVLAPGEPVYMGHSGYIGELVRFVMSGGGVLVRGETLRSMTGGNTLQWCIERIKDSWCWHHLDWALAMCLREVGVFPRGHQGMQQMIDVCAASGKIDPALCCAPPKVSCHPVPAGEREWMLRSHQAWFVANEERLTTTWARPCLYSDYMWTSYWYSNCIQ
eukprot:SRR837773.14079.p1 GENE.SRR837773.14079~~SRR837773.14079.p1  ORF type:complete len:333 (-),score=65.12 SRR837773.14079:30-941(-)